MVAGPATALLGVSSLDLAPLAATSGAFFVGVRDRERMSFPRKREPIVPPSAASGIWVPACAGTTPRAHTAVVTVAAKTKRASQGRRASVREAKSVAQARRVRHLLPLRQAFGDDLRRLHGGLAQGGVFDDLALHARGLGLQHVAQGLQLADELLDLLHRRACYPLQQLPDICGYHLAVALRLPPQAGRNVAAHEVADFPFHFRLPRRLDVGGLTRLEKGHVRYPRSAPCGLGSTTR